MDINSYNTYFSVIKNVNDIKDANLANKMIDEAKEEMISKYGVDDDDVKHLLRLFLRAKAL